MLPLELLHDRQASSESPIPPVFLVELHKMLPANKLAIDLIRYYNMLMPLNI